MKRQQKADWLLSHRHLLNFWEHDFTASLSAQFQVGDGITPRQGEVLDRVFLKCSLMLPPEDRLVKVIPLNDRRTEDGSDNWREQQHGEKAE